ncbi:MAG: hypothetical protein ABIQ16_18770 [Polyangiaceae bacterium]
MREFLDELLHVAMYPESNGPKRMDRSGRLVQLPAPGVRALTDDERISVALEAALAVTEWKADVIAKQLAIRRMRK